MTARPRSEALRSESAVPVLCWLPVDHAAVRRREINAAKDAHVPGDCIDRAELMLIVIDAQPCFALVIGAEKSVGAGDLTGGVDCRVIVPRRGLSEANTVSAVNCGNLLERLAGV